MLALTLRDWWKFHLASSRREKFLPCCPVGWLKLCLPRSLWNLSIATEGSLRDVKFEYLLLGLCADCSQVMAVPLGRMLCTKVNNSDSQSWKMVLWISCYSPSSHDRGFLYCPDTGLSWLKHSLQVFSGYLRKVLHEFQAEVYSQFVALGFTLGFKCIYINPTLKGYC